MYDMGRLKKSENIDFVEHVLSDDKWTRHWTLGTDLLICSKEQKKKSR